MSDATERTQSIKENKQFFDGLTKECIKIFTDAGFKNPAFHKKTTGTWLNGWAFQVGEDYYNTATPSFVCTAHRQSRFDPWHVTVVLTGNDQSKFGWGRVMFHCGCTLSNLGHITEFLEAAMYSFLCCKENCGKPETENVEMDGN